MGGAGGGAGEQEKRRRTAAMGKSGLQGYLTSTQDTLLRGFWQVRLGFTITPLRAGALSRGTVDACHTIWVAFFFPIFLYYRSSPTDIPSMSLLHFLVHS